MADLKRDYEKETAKHEKAQSKIVSKRVAPAQAIPANTCQFFDLEKSDVNDQLTANDDLNVSNSPKLHPQ